MMILAIVITIFSCLLQGIISNYLGYTFDNISAFSTLYILIALLIVRPYFENEKKFLIILILFGLIVDIVYTSTPIFNTVIFILVCYSFNYQMRFNNNHQYNSSFGKEASTMNDSIRSNLNRFVEELHK